MPDYTQPLCPRPPDMTVALHPCSIAELAAEITMSAEINAAGVAYIELCNSEGDNIIFEACKIASGDVQYTGSDGTTFSGNLGTLLAAGYGLCNSKKYIGTVEGIDPEDEKKGIIIYEWLNPDGTPCFTTDQEGSDIINDINIYQMSRLVGLPMPENLVNKTKVKSFEFCPVDGLVGTFQDLLDEAIARGLLLPDGTVPTGAVKIRILQEYAGQIVNGKKTSAVGITVTDGAEPFSLDGGQDYCTEEPTIDADCDGFLGLCVDLTTPVEFPVGAGAVIEIVGAPCDANDADKDVQ